MGKLSEKGGRGPPKPTKLDKLLYNQQFIKNSNRGGGKI